MSKQFHVMERVGKSRYVVNHHDGVKTHRDGSRFFDITICGSKRRLSKVVSGLLRNGYEQTR